MNKKVGAIMALSAAVVLMVLATYGPRSDAAGEAQSYTFNPENQMYWVSVLRNYRDRDDVRQLLLVRCTEGSNAVVQYYQKLTDQKNAWTLIFEGSAFIGKNGTGKTREGDAKTPLGDFGVRSAFGILDNPGTKLPYIPVTETTFACDENGPYYNRIIDTAETGHACAGEEMLRCSPEYNYGIETDYNASNEWPKGSAIFLHCKGAKVYTGGCIAIDEDMMKTVLMTAEPGMRVIIHAE